MNKECEEGDEHEHEGCRPILSRWNCVVRNRGDRVTGERKESEDRATDGQTHDLPRFRFNSEDHERRDK